MAAPRMSFQERSAEAGRLQTQLASAQGSAARAAAEAAAAQAAAADRLAADDREKRSLRGALEGALADIEQLQKQVWWSFLVCGVSGK